MQTRKRFRIAFNIFLAATLIVACEKQNIPTDRLSITNSNPPPGGGTSPPPTFSSWNLSKNIPGPLGVKGRFDAWSFSIGSRGYIGGGEIENRTGGFVDARDQYYFDSTTNSWTQTASMPGENLAGAVSFVIDRKAYVSTGGSAAAFVSNQTWQYNYASNVWTRKADFPGGRRIWASGAASGERGYLGTGVSERDGEGIQYNDWWQYDPTADTWVRKADYAGIGRWHTVTFTSPAALGGKIYLGTGYFAVNAINGSFSVYDPKADTWADAPAMPRNMGRTWATGISLPQGGVVLAGYNGVTIAGYNDAYEFSFATNAWAQIPSFTGSRIAASGFALGNNLYIAGGFSYSYTIEPVAHDDMYTLKWPY